MYAADDGEKIDAPSKLGQFGWDRVGNGDEAIPVIVRNNQIRYSPVRIVEQELIKRYDLLPQTVFQCITLKSFYLTPDEARLLNTINFNHCETRYGPAFFSTKDVIISSPDVKELSRFLNISHKVFNQGLAQFSPKLGIVKLFIGPPDARTFLCIPYIGKRLQASGMVSKFVPSKLVECFVTTSSTCVRADPSEWDVMYLKMLCIFCENKLQHRIVRDNSIVLLDGLVYTGTGGLVQYEEVK